LFWIRQELALLFQASGKIELAAILNTVVALLQGASHVL
jgi:hypothetical protein